MSSAYFSFEKGVFETPTTPNAAGRCAPSARLYRAGSSFLWARSPLAPKTTTAQGSGDDSARSPGRSGFGTSSCSGEYGISALLDRVAAELVAEGGLDLGGEGLLLAGGEPAEERQRDHRSRNVLVHRRLDRPATFAAVLDISLDRLQARVLLEGVGEKIEQPGADDAPLHPGAGDPSQIEIGERRRLEDLEALAVRGHEPVLDPVVHHLHVMARAPPTRVDEPVFPGEGRGGGGGGAPRG